MRDPSSRLRMTWGAEAWRLRHPGTAACWDLPRNGGGDAFFDNAEAGSTCARNWYEGSPGLVGMWGPNDDDGDPRFTEAAPALLGFDDAIDFYIGNMDGGGLLHADASVRHNVNILQLWPPAVYDTCANYQWLVCAAKGLLHGQGDNQMLFAYPPGRLSVVSGPDGPQPRDWSEVPPSPEPLSDRGLPAMPAPRCAGAPDCYGWEGHQALGSTDSYAGEGCESTDQCYWSGDIFHLEVCLLNAICDNGEELFHLQIGQPWRCQLSQQRMASLKSVLLSS